MLQPIRLCPSWPLNVRVLRLPAGTDSDRVAAARAYRAGYDGARTAESDPEVFPEHGFYPASALPAL